MSQQPSRYSWLMVGAWFGLALLALWLIWARLSMTVDLAYFLPAPESEQEQVLMDRLGQGPGSRLMFIVLQSGVDADLYAQSRQLKNSLDASGHFVLVLNGQERAGINALPAVIHEQRYLLSDNDFSEQGLHAALGERLADLAVLSGAEFNRLIGSDPFLASVALMESIAWPGMSEADNWQDNEANTALLVAESVAPAFDVGAQFEVLDLIAGAARGVGAAGAEVYGVGAYGVGLQSTIKSEARMRSLLATLAIALVLYLGYRRSSVLLLAAVPLAMGAIGGLLAVTLLFGQVHGITLAFGFTLFGVAVDYPLHYFGHVRRHGEAHAIEMVWKTMRLGAFSTVIAYLAIAVAGSRGLAQLGVFSVVGVIVALYATRFLLPALTTAVAAPARPAAERAAISPALRHYFWVPGLLLAGITLALQGPLWSHDLSALTPLPRETLRKDNELRQSIGAPDIRYLLALRADSEEEVLLATEALQATLFAAQKEGLVEHVRLVSAVLPSKARQEQRRALIPAADELRGRLTAAIAGTPFRQGSFGRFVADAQTQKRAAPITSAAFRGSVLDSFVGSHLYRAGPEWVSLVTLYGMEDPEQFREWFAARDSGAEFVDLKQASIDLVTHYRARIQTILLFAFVLIVALLFWRIGASARLLWVVGTLAAAVLMTTSIGVLVLGSLSLFSLIALVLVAGLGLDYALFMSRNEVAIADAGNTRHAVLICAASTWCAFTVLAFSSVPVLQSLGLTVSVGVGLNYALAWLGSKSSAAQATT